MSPSLIHAARTAQLLAVRALTAYGLAHPVTRLLLAAASTAAAQAWDRGHAVHAVHPAPPQRARRDR
ncbi:hypothetical protein [Streptomyces sp. CFMR 7]|uniref:hypothetical protein n=1 Tax=Streptomyces sp. CFMR 7 TaxID=1649184 RepID=UPI0006AD5BA2|nr:hypothetical protein [Streptomyces sp. CFMR 7]ALC32323.1 hypothetical protein ABE83_34750 [Streptomyces sp. CFMR 7]